MDSRSTTGSSFIIASSSMASSFTIDSFSGLASRLASGTHSGGARVGAGDGFGTGGGGILGGEGFGVRVGVGVPRHLPRCLITTGRRHRVIIIFKRQRLLAAG